MTSKRYVVGERATEGRRAHLVSTSVGPHEYVDADASRTRKACFRSFDRDGKPKGVVADMRFLVKRDVLVERRAGVNWAGPYGASVARETDDPAIIEEIDAAARAVAVCREALAAAIVAERETLEMLVPRMRPARVSEESNQREADARAAYVAEREAAQLAAIEKAGVR